MRVPWSALTNFFYYPSADNSLQQYQYLEHTQQSASILAAFSGKLDNACANDEFLRTFPKAKSFQTLPENFNSTNSDGRQMIFKLPDERHGKLLLQNYNSNISIVPLMLVAPTVTSVATIAVNSFCNDMEGWITNNLKGTLEFRSSRFNTLLRTRVLIQKIFRIQAFKIPKISFLSVLPRVILLIFGIFKLNHLLRMSAPSIPTTVIYITKVACSALLIFSSSINLIALRVFSDIYVSPYVYLDSFSALIAALFSILLVRLDHHRSRTNSSLLLLYWLSALTIDFLVLRTLLIRASNGENGTLMKILVANRAIDIFLIFSLFVIENIPKPKSYYITLDEDLNQSPEATANIFSILTFHWIYPLMKLGSLKDLGMDDLWSLRQKDSSHYNAEAFSLEWSSEIGKKNPSLSRALFKTYGFFYSMSVFHDVCAFLQPIYLRWLINFAASWSTERKSEPQSLNQGLAISIIMFFTAVSQTIALHQYFQIAFICGMRVRGALVGAIYKKALRLSNNSRQKSTVGEIVNLMSVDASRIMDTNLQILLNFESLLYHTLGVAIFAGVAVMIVMIPINAAIVSITRKLSKIQMSNKDGRIKLMDEVLNGIKVIKLYAWEQSFLSKIYSVRKLELDTLKRIGYVSAISSFTWAATPFFVSFLSFAVYSVIGNEPLTSAKIFVALSLFNLLQFPLSAFPSTITSLAEASVSILRELDRKSVNYEAIPTQIDGTHAMKLERVSVHDASFSWTKDLETEILKNINFKVHDRTLLSICGRVGSGKSSVLSALLGEMYKIKGNVSVRGSVAFVPQTAWIMNQTVRENILFGKRFDSAFYEQTISACGLQPDLEVLPAGDLTEIGERGINLSGGQKQRISLARAVYSRADIYLLDDPLSAVDAHVGAHIFEKVLGPKGLLKDKCRILVTHAIQFIPQSDLILNLVEGEICELGTFEELMLQDSCTKNLLREYGKRKENISNESLPDLNTAVESIQNAIVKVEIKTTSNTDIPKKIKSGNIISKEESAKGAVSWDVYIAYGKSCGVFMVAAYLCIAVFTQLLSVFQNLYLSNWASENDHADEAEKSNDVKKLLVYVIFVWVFCAIRSAKYLHEGMLNTIIRAPQSFFDTTPLGRILNRFAKDQSAIDEILPRIFQQFFRTILGVFSVLLDSTSRSPIYANFSETLGGVASIRAYKQESRFVQTNEEKVDSNQQAYYASISSNRWLAVRLELIGSIIVFASAFFAVMTIYIYGSIDASLVGLMLIYSLNVTQTLNWCVRQSCEIETNIVSVERVIEYSEVQTEAPAYCPEIKLPDSWPSSGAVSFKNYSTKYRSELDLVLKNVSFDVRPGEKIGIVGRTGAGKSSLTLALFRMIEPTEGKIVIDGFDVTSLGLFDLRSRLTIIPQDPVLFAGTIRSNLDPFDKYDDAALWEALESSSLKDKIMSKEKKLEEPVFQGGENYSVGQRQLICLARDILKKNKILLLDEATAAIDVETDEIIQKAIRREFSDCTTLTIAHRINTVMDCDRILVLEKGNIVEFDRPAVLLENKLSIFYGLAKEAGMAR
ncbi:hypothetical protein HK096_003457 [Nowakowskiella sp. JEL0078]|nr:hypothetical protein HK096_003457 [Nowakowskiella sp. JEL0078]